MTGGQSGKVLVLDRRNPSSKAFCGRDCLSRPAALTTLALEVPCLWLISLSPALKVSFPCKSWTLWTLLPLFRSSWSLWAPQLGHHPAEERTAPHWAASPGAHFAALASEARKQSGTWCARNCSEAPGAYCTINASWQYTGSWISLA